MKKKDAVRFILPNGKTFTTPFFGEARRILVQYGYRPLLPNSVWETCRIYRCHVNWDGVVLKAVKVE